MFAGRRVLLGRITAKQLQQQQQNNAVAATRRRRLPSTAAAPAAAPVATVGAIRCLNVHEYISMEIMKNHGIPTPECFVAKTPEEAEHIFSRSLNRRKCNAIKNLLFCGLLLLSGNHCMIAQTSLFSPPFVVFLV